MRYRLSALGTIVSLLFAGTTIGAEQYALDPPHSHIGFSIQHLVIGHVRGTFTEVAGTLLYDEADLTKSSVKVTIQTSSIDTHNADRDKHLRSPDFFDVKKYPEITFQSQRIERQGDSYLCVGNLTMHGVSKEIEIPFEIAGKVKDPWGTTRIGVEAELTLNRQDFGISWNKTMDNGGLVIGNKVKVTLNVEAIQSA